MIMNVSYQPKLAWPQASAAEEAKDFAKLLRDLRC